MILDPYEGEEEAFYAIKEAIFDDPWIRLEDLFKIFKECCPGYDKNFTNWKNNWYRALTKFHFVETKPRNGSNLYQKEWIRVDAIFEDYLSARSDYNRYKNETKLSTKLKAMRRLPGFLRLDE